MENEKKKWPAELLELFDDPLLEGADVNSKNIREKLMAVSLQTLKEMGLWI